MTKILMTKTRGQESLEFENWNLFGICNLELGISNNTMVGKENKNLITRPPVVVVLGHVDHGKSSILEAIKDLKITEKEAGGITQHIGAYEVEHQQKKITFIDTPGHEAFKALRSRGAKVADIAILVVDATEGVKAQTREAISHIKMAQLPMIVALNKMDLPQADPERVKRELEKEGIKVESLGGKIPAIELSAKTGQGIPDLLELILLVAEMEDLKTVLSGPARGVVIESYLDSQRGPTATLLVKEGKLKRGDVVGTLSTWGKVKILEDFQGRPLKEAIPSEPAVVIGFAKVPWVGERFQVFADIKEAQQNIRPKEKKEIGKVLLVSPEKKVLNLILKADVLGSLEAIDEVLRNLPQEKVTVRVLSKGVGPINETDLKLARSGKAKILGFRVKPDAIAKRLAERDDIKILSFEVIYELSQAVRTLMERMLEPEITREELGKIKVLVVFKRDKKRQIIGGKVIKGEVSRGTMIEVLRPSTSGDEEGEKVGEGKLENLQKNKKDIEKGTKGDEVGIMYEGTGQIEEGDILVIYKEERKKAEL